LTNLHHVISHKPFIRKHIVSSLAINSVLGQLMLQLNITSNYYNFRLILL